jgi:hypothetical protein
VFAPPPPPAPTTGVLEGRVLTQDERPVSGARIDISAADVAKTATTGTDGEFRVDELPAGTYQIAISATDLLGFSSSETVTAGEATSLTVRLAPVAVSKAPESNEALEFGATATVQAPPREVTKRTLPAEELNRVAGTRGDALRAIELMPGVARPPGGMGLVIIRGSAPTDSEVYLEGTAVPRLYHFGGLTSFVQGRLLDRIDMYPGNFSARFGRKLGGVVDVAVRDPKSDGLHAMLDINVIDASALVEGPVSEHVSVAAAFRRSYIDAWFGPLANSADLAVSAAPVYYDYQAMVEHDVSKNTTARLAFFGSDDRMRFVLNAPDPKDPQFGGDFGEALSMQRLQLRTDTRFGGGGRWRNTVAVGRDHHDFQIGTAHLDLTYEPVSVRSDVRVPLARGIKLVGGIDMLWMGVNADYAGPAINDYGESQGPFFAQPTNSLAVTGSRFLPAAYTMLELSPVPSLRIMPGLRADYTSEIDQTRVSPRLSARWDVAPGFPRTTVKGGIGLFYQPPEPYESVEPFGNPSLSHERAVHYGLGVEQEITRNVEVSLDGFYRHLDDIVIQRPDSRLPSGSAYSNSGTGRAYGGELLLRYKSDGRFFGWLSYTLSRSELRDADGERTHLSQWDQTHILTAVGSYQLGRGWTLGARWRFVSGNPYTPPAAAVYDADAGAYQPSYGEKYSARMPAFHQLDVRVDKTWTFTHWKLSAYLDVQNAYNRKNPEGRAYNFNYSRSDAIAGLPVLPIVGLRGEL